jgi:hypothetical protein
MALSSTFVVWNSSRLRHFSKDHQLVAGREPSPKGQPALERAWEEVTLAK